MAATEIPIAPDQRAVFAKVLEALRKHNVKFLVGGGFGLFCYLEHWRNTKDLDIFLKGSDVERALEVLAGVGFQVELTDPRWLAKARLEGALTDIIFCSYNGLFPVDDSWFANARPEIVLGVPTVLVGPEEMIVSKAFVAARDRFDGSDISWLLRALGREIDWQRVERLFGDEHWPVLLWQLIHFLYVFPAERDVVPRSLLERLTSKFHELATNPHQPLVCYGPMLDPQSYRLEVGRRDEADQGTERPRLVNARDQRVIPSATRH